jgi:hypothetical protein
MFDDGSFVAVWERDYEIRGRSFDAGTTTMSSEFHVTAGDAGRFPAVATYDGPGFVVVWDDDGGPGLYARRFVFPDQVGVSAKKLVVVDKLAAAGKAKLVYVANNDGGITKGTGTDVDAISAQLTVAYADGSTMGAFVLPAGASDGTSGWKVNKDTVAKYVNKTAPDGPTQAKAGVVKPGKLLKLVGKGLGDTPIDIFGAGAPTMQPSGQVVTSYCMVNGGEATCHCTTFAECSYKLIAADTGAKLVCKNGGPDADCAAVGGP